MSLLQRYYRRPQQVALRRLNFQVHLWAGIILTLYMIVIGVTGSMLVFRPEIERLCGLKPWQGLATQSAAADIATVVENLEAAYPRSRIVSVDAPGPEEATFVAVIEGHRGDLARGRLKVACDPADGRLLGEFPHGSSWLDIVQELHVTLLIHPGSRGRMLNGIGAAVSAPAERHRNGDLVAGHPELEARAESGFRRNWRRINFDLHVCGGFLDHFADLRSGP